MNSGGKRSHRRGRFLPAAVNLLGMFTALAMIMHILLVLTKPASNLLFTVVDQWAGLLALWWGTLFKPPDSVVNVTLNYLVAAVFWLLVTRVVARVLR